MSTTKRFLPVLLALGLTACASPVQSGPDSAVASSSERNYKLQGFTWASLTQTVALLPTAPRPVQPAPIAPAPTAPGIGSNPLFSFLNPAPIPAPPADPAPPAPAPAPGANPAPATGIFTIVNPVALVAQFRPTSNRLRIDSQGDVDPAVVPAQSSLNAIGSAANATPPGIKLVCHANVVLRGTTTSIIPTGALTVTNLTPAVGDVGAVAGTTAQGHLIQLTWPSLDATLPPGPPIFRIELASWAAGVNTGTALDITYNVQSVDAAGTVLTEWRGAANNLVVPAAR